jgi:UDP-N-acetyl-2-amino-2-deoxyglucuronate dehydrogenase
MGDSIGFGILGLGMGAGRAKQVADTEGAKVAAVCDLDAARREKAVEEHGCPAFDDFDEMLKCDDVDVVYVMTPSGTHAHFGKKAAAAGKHVVTTKPMDLTTARCDELIKTCADAGTKLVVDFESRYFSKLRQLKAAMDSGELGDIILVEARCKWWRTQDYYEHMGGWRGTWKLDGGGSLANQSIHVIDMLAWLGGPWKNVVAKVGTFGHEIETEDLGMAMLDFESGANGLVLGTTTYSLNDQFGIEVNGTLGSASNVQNWRDMRVKFPDGRTELETPEPAGHAQSASEDMVQAILEDKVPDVSGEEGRKAIALLQAIYDAAGVGDERRRAIEG